MMLINFLNKPLSLFDSDILSRCTVSIRLRVEPHCHLDLLLFLLVSAIIIADLTSIQRMHAFVRIATYISVLVQYYMGISLSVEQQLRVLEVRSGRYCVCDIRSWQSIQIQIQPGDLGWLQTDIASQLHCWSCQYQVIKSNANGLGI